MDMRSQPEHYTVRRAERWLVVVAALVVGAAAAPPAFAEVDASAAVAVSAASDSNPLRVRGDGPDGAFVETDAAAALSAGGAGSRWFLHASGVDRTHDGRARAADTRRARLRTGWSLEGDRAGRRFALQVGASYETARSTFVDRDTGAAYVYDPDPLVPGDEVDLSGRFDADAVGGFAEARLDASRRVRLSFAARAGTTRYAHDYAGVAGLDALDHDTVVLRPGVVLQLHPMLALDLATEWSRVRYDSSPARDASGAGVPGTRREDRGGGIDVVLRVAPSHRWKLRTGLRGGQRDDPFAGYYDTDSRTAFAHAEFRASFRTRVSLSAAWQSVDYAQLAIPDDPNGETYASDARTWAARATWDLLPRLDLFVEAGTSRVSSPDPTYAHDRNWWTTGLRLRSDRPS